MNYPKKIILSLDVFLSLRTSCPSGHFVPLGFVSGHFVPLDVVFLQTFPPPISSSLKAVGRVILSIAYQNVYNGCEWFTHCLNFKKPYIKWTDETGCRMTQHGREKYEKDIQYVRGAFKSKLNCIHILMLLLDDETDNILWLYEEKMLWMQLFSIYKCSTGEAKVSHSLTLLP